MANYSDTLQVLTDFRFEVIRRQQTQSAAEARSLGEGAFSAFSTPMNNVHATGVGLRVRNGRPVIDEHVLKLFVYEKLSPESLGEEPMTEFRGVPVDVEQLPIQMALSQRYRQRPIPGGVSIAPSGSSFVGTLGCMLSRVSATGNELLILSNNHVIADVNQLPKGTQIVQPGAEQPPFATQSQDVFASLEAFVSINFPSPGNSVTNRFDAAVARVIAPDLVQTASMYGGLRFDPSQVSSPYPGMEVTKVGRTTGITRGLVLDTRVQGEKVNYGTLQQPQIAVFDDVLHTISYDGSPFSDQGDSGSIILEETTGYPVALLFAGDGSRTTASELAPVCAHFGAWPT